MFSCVFGVLQCMVEKIFVVIANEMLERRIVLRMRQNFTVTGNFVAAAGTLVYTRWLTYNSILNNDFVLVSHPRFDFVAAADTPGYTRWLTYNSTLNNAFVLASHPRFDFYARPFDDTVSSLQNELTSICVCFLLCSESRRVS